jgi:histidinol-phosphatase
VRAVTATNAYADDMRLALELADAGDGITSARFGASDLHVETKPDLTPVSDADRTVEQAIRARLGENRPEDSVIGEEFGGPDDPRGRSWVIDPIDGTKNFVRGVPVWATLIALLDDPNGVDVAPVVGVVSAPALGRRWWAHRGGGAWTTGFGGPGRRIAVSAVADLANASLSFSSLAGWKALGRQEAFVALTGRVWRTRGFGDFWSYMLLAEGAVDLADEPELSLWDMAALAPIVTEAGGRFSGLDGVDGIRQGNAAASNGLLHEAFLAALHP